MKRSLRSIFIVLAVLLIVAQAIRPERTNPPVTGEINAPPEIKSILRKTCYNCHSNETVWPWYSQVAPASWLLAHDVSNARKRVNFSEWSSLTPRRQAGKLRKADEEIKEGDMPLWYYLPLHPEARLSDADKSALMAWLNAQASAQGE
jgi:cytochrome c551/c552